jgi:ribosome assembly protein 1
VLRQAWRDRVQPLLVINKIDRLILELKLTPLEAYRHLTRILEQVNAAMGQLYTGELLEQELKKHQQSKESEIDQEDLMDFDDEHLYFSPEKGNVIFTSAIDGWAFRYSF